MVIDSQIASDMQAAIEDVYLKLPEHYRTEIIRNEIARVVVRTKAHGREGYEKAARAAVHTMFSSLDRVIESPMKLARVVR